MQLYVAALIQVTFLSAVLMTPTSAQDDVPHPPPASLPADSEHPEHSGRAEAHGGIHQPGNQLAGRNPQAPGSHPRRRLFPGDAGPSRGGPSRQAGVGRRRKFRQEADKEEREAKSKPAVALDGAKTLDDVLAAEEALQRFLSIADSLGMRDIFAETEDITVLAVSNEVELAAWEAEIAADPDPSKYIDRMKRHILTESMPFDAMSNVQPVPTMSEEILVISHRDGGRIVVYDDDTYELAQIVRTDLEGSNGFVHIVDRVLVRHADVLRP